MQSSRCKAHDAKLTMGSSRWEAHDGKLTMQSSRRQAHDTIKASGAVAFKGLVSVDDVDYRGKCLGLAKEDTQKISGRRCNLQGCCNSVTVVRIWHGPRAESVPGGPWSMRNPHAFVSATRARFKRARFKRARFKRARFKRARFPCAARRACARSDRAVFCADGSISASPRPVRRLRYRRAPFPASCGSAA